MFTLIATADDSVKKIFGDGVTEGPFGTRGTVGENFSQFFGFAVNIIIAIAAISVLFMMLWGALDYIYSGGDPKMIEKARGKIIAALVGIFILIAVLIIWVFISTNFLGTVSNKNSIFRINLPSVRETTPGGGGGGGGRSQPNPD